MVEVLDKEQAEILANNSSTEAVISKKTITSRQHDQTIQPASEQSLTAKTQDARLLQQQLEVSPEELKQFEEEMGIVGGVVKAKVYRRGPSSFPAPQSELKPCDSNSQPVLGNTEALAVPSFTIPENATQQEKEQRIQQMLHDIDGLLSHLEMNS
ncbi:hypothetical protein GUITHDRAFT_154070 [Guillardia theta CCMP2712]|uniref:Uncharacterized protein n=2 Tax=Guillardia theta TaxID=55529 RepID=L1IY53_GUITC|nr:hypothetical protein GUITHDRAFT_154070 [Guillardia theta CCMP2712]EKX40755.1 hypothetical protein GUITHDRAFT_154070 [Guillardia theta CCMP2712]|eukprot:XP_005827735.1 hypothetical protein GUITHDRAFT_154070 [Guillardia theta CCMP2712]